jgi:hypothetical protein
MAGTMALALTRLGAGVEGIDLNDPTDEGTRDGLAPARCSTISCSCIRGQDLAPRA